MVAQFMAGLSAGARALLKTPAGQRAVDKGSKAVARFLKNKDPSSFKPSDAQKIAGQRLQKTMKRRALNKNVKVGAGSGAAGVAAGRATKSDDKKREDFRDMKANARKKSRKKREDAFKEGRVQKTRKETATLLNKGGKVKKPTLVEKLKAKRQEYKEATKKLRANETDEEREFRYRMSRSPMERFKSGGAVRNKARRTFVDKFREDTPLGIGKILTPIESSGIGGAYKKMTKGLGEKIAKKKTDKKTGKKTSNMQPLKKPSVKRLKESKRAVPRAIGKGIDKVVGKRIPLKDLRKTDAQYRAGLKAGGLVKKKGIDGIAMRGKTKATRSR
jgi:hypothetical protein